MKIVFIDALKKGNNGMTDEEEKIKMDDFEIPEDEIKIINEFLCKFNIVSESSLD